MGYRMTADTTLSTVTMLQITMDTMLDFLKRVATLLMLLWLCISALNFLKPMMPQTSPAALSQKPPKNNDIGPARLATIIRFCATLRLRTS